MGQADPSEAQNGGKGMSLNEMFTASAFEHKRTCRFDRQGRPFVHDAPTAMTEGEFKAVMKYVNNLDWRLTGKKK